MKVLYVADGDGLREAKFHEIMHRIGAEEHRCRRFVSIATLQEGGGTWSTKRYQCAKVLSEPDGTHLNGHTAFSDESDEGKRRYQWD